MADDKNSTKFDKSYERRFLNSLDREKERRFSCPKIERRQWPMYFTSGRDRVFERLMQGKPGFDHYDSNGAITPEDCGTCRFYRPHWQYQFCVYAECRYQSGKLTAYDAVKFRVKGVENMAVFRVEKNRGYTVMSNHHLRDITINWIRDWAFAQSRNFATGSFM